MISLKSKREINIVRQAGTIVSRTLDELANRIMPGITTATLDAFAAEYIVAAGGIPSFKDYHGFPAHICASINDEVVHGIPSSRKLQEGDIISIDVGVQYNGYHADAARTWPVGAVKKEAVDLIEVTRQSFYEGIAVIKPGAHLGDLSHAIQTYVESHGYSIVRDFVGHGIGRELHEEPQIPNFGTRGTGPLLEKGMVLAIEPMVNQGTWRVHVLDNKWTVVTQDRALSAHYENTVVIRDHTAEVVT